MEFTNGKQPGVRMKGRRWLNQVSENALESVIRKRVGKRYTAPEFALTSQPSGSFL